MIGAHRAALRIMAPPPDLTLSEWSDRNRYLSPEASSEPGRWVTAKAPFQREIMDSISDPSIHTVVLMTSSQVGKTEVGVCNPVGYFIDQDPSPILVLQPTLEMAEAWSKDRLAPMLRDSPALKGKVAEANARNSGNTLLHKTFAGGHVTMAGANSAASLAMRPIRVLLCDEVDRYPESAGTEGDPVSLAWKRTTTFWNRKRVLSSTPGTMGASRIAKAYAQTDMRQRWVPCPHCRTLQVLKWEQIRWDRSSDDPETAVLICSAEGCGAVLTDADRVWMDREENGAYWIPQRPEVKRSRGYAIWEAYSPWRRLAEIVESFLEAERNGHESMKTWVNTCKGECWDPGDGQELRAEGLMSRAEPIPTGTLPAGAAMLTAGIDVQDDRIELVIEAWGQGEERWTLRHRIIAGNLVLNEPWDELERELRAVWAHPAGVEMSVKAAAIDIGGHFTKRVYQFARRPSLRGLIHPVKGASTPQPRMVKRSGSKARLWLVDTNTAKDLVSAQIRIETAGPGYFHFVKDLDADFFKQLLSERVRVRGSKRVWEKIKAGARNEALDCVVYSYAALAIFNPKDLGALVPKAKGEQEGEAAAVDQVEPEAPPRISLGQANKAGVPRRTLAAKSPRRGNGGAW